MYINPKLIWDTSEALQPDHFEWRSPSNIAIVKYWGKYGEQLPRNPSFSFTLSAAYTQMRLDYQLKEVPDNEIDLQFFFHGAPNEAFASKIKTFLQRLQPVFPFLTQLELVIHSENSFPHSAGIASSASSMSALALCLCSLEDRLFGTLRDQQEFDRKASWVARLGSGSACRSIFPYASVWGTTSALPGSSEEFGMGAEGWLHDTFKDFHDDILIVSKEEKSVSSRAGHALMEGHPFAESRYTQARKNINTLEEALRVGDLDTFGRIAEEEALTLHALMMCSHPSYMLMRPNSLAMIEKIRAYRTDTGHPVFFTLDAGPNIHLMYPGAIVHEVRGFIENDLKPLCEQGYYIQDWVGEGPEEL